MRAEEVGELLGWLYHFCGNAPSGLVAQKSGCIFSHLHGDLDLERLAAGQLRLRIAEAVDGGIDLLHGKRKRVAEPLRCVWLKVSL